MFLKGLIMVFLSFKNLNKRILGPVFCLDVTQDNKYIVSGSSDRSIKVIDFEKRETVHSFTGIHEGKEN